MSNSLAKSITARSSIIFLVAIIFFSPLNTVLSYFLGINFKVNAADPVAPVISGYSIARSGGWNNGLILDQKAHFDNTNTYPIIGQGVTLGANFSDDSDNLLTARLGVHAAWFRQESSWGGIAEGMYDFNWDTSSQSTFNYTTGLADTSDGLRRVLFQAQDGANPDIYNTVDQEYSVIVDNTAPVVSYGPSTPAEGSTVSGTITIDGDFNDNYGLFDVRLGINGVAWYCYTGPTNVNTNDTPANGYYSCNIDTAALPNGDYTVAIQGLDKAGNTTNLTSRNIHVTNYSTVGVCKVDQYGNPVGNWSMQLDGTNGYSQSLSTDAISGCSSFVNVPIGPATLTEESKLGWVPIDLKDNGVQIATQTVSQNISVDSENESFTFANKRLPVVDIDETFAKYTNGYVCGIGSAYDDDGLRVNIKDWESGYILMGRYFIAGGSFSSWFDLQGAGTLTLSGNDAIFTALNTGNSPEGAAGWEVKVVDSTNADISNIDSFNYTITTDPNSLACGHEILLGFETAENSPQTGAGQCTVTTNDLSMAGNTASLQTLRWESVSGVSKYLISGYVWNGSSWTTSYVDYEIPWGDLDVISEPGYVIYSGWATGEGKYAYEIKALDASDNLIGKSNAIDDVSDCSFIVDRTAPVTVISSPTNNSYWKTAINFSGSTSDLNDVGMVDLYFRVNGSSDPWIYITTLSNINPMDTFNWSYLWTPGFEGSFDLMASGKDLAGNIEGGAFVTNVVYDVTPPFVEVTSHDDGDHVSGIVQIRGTVQDENLLRYYFVVQNSSNTTIAGPGTVYSNTSFIDQLLLNWDTTSLPGGTYTIKLEARDDAGNKVPDPTTSDPNDPSDSVDWVTVIVDNNPPILTLPSNIFTEATGPSGAVVDYVASAIDTEDGSVPINCTPASGSLFALGVTTVDCSASDSAGNTTTGSFSITVQDTTAPDTPTLLNPFDGEVRNTTGMVMDWSDVFDFGNVSEPISYYYQSSLSSTVDVNGVLTSPIYTPGVLSISEINAAGTPNGTYYWQVRACDTVGNCSNWSSVWSVIVDNTAPTVDEISDQTINEGDNLITDFDWSIFNNLGVYDNYGLNKANIRVQFVGLHGEVEDTGEMELDISFLGTGASLPADVLSYILGLGLTEAVVDTSIIPEGTYTITYYVTDLAGNNSELHQVNIEIKNVAPVVTLLSSQTINEGDEAVFTAEFSDPSSHDIGDMIYDDADWEVFIDYGEGDGFTSLGFMSEPGNIESVLGNFNHTYLNANNSPYTVTLKVCESSGENSFAEIVTPLAMMTSIGEGECSTSSVTITVNNLAPAVNILANPGTSVLASTPITLTAQTSGGNVPLSYVWGGNCSGNDVTTILNTSPAGVFNCSVTVTDADGDTASANITLTSTNGAASVVVYALPSLFVTAGTSVNIYGNILSGDANFNYVWSGACSGSGTSAGGVFGPTTVPTVAGTYYCRVDITDANGDTAAAGLTVSVTNPSSILGVGSPAPANNTTPQGSNLITTPVSSPVSAVQGLTDQKCEERVDVSGKVFIDTNNNGKFDSEELGAENIGLNVYLVESNKNSLVAKFSTDNSGNWSTEVCPGSYTIDINKETIPSGYILSSENTEFEASLDKILGEINIAITKKDTAVDFPWWILVLLGAVGTTVVIFTRTKKDQPVG